MQTSEVLSVRSAVRTALADRIFRALLILFAVVNLADVGTTLAVLHLGGGEGSWLQAWIFAHVSVAAGIALKLAAASFIAGNIALTFNRAHPRTRWFERAELLALDAALVLVVLNNAAVLAFLLSPHPAP